MMKGLINFLMNKKVAWTVSTLYYALFLVYIMYHFKGIENEYSVKIGYAGVILYAFMLAIDSLTLIFYKDENDEGVSRRSILMLRYSVIPIRIFGFWLFYWIIVPQTPASWALVVWLGVQVVGHSYIKLSMYIAFKMFPHVFYNAKKEASKCRPLTTQESVSFPKTYIDMERNGNQFTVTSDSSIE